MNSGCDAVDFSVIKVGSKPQICYTKALVEFLLDNGPSVDLYDIHARIVGKDGIYSRETILEVPLGKADAVKVKIPYENTGAIEQIKLTPKIMVDSNVIMCGNAAKVIEDIPAC